MPVTVDGRVHFVIPAEARRGLKPRRLGFCVQPCLSNYETLRTGLQIPSGCAKPSMLYLVDTTIKFCVCNHA